MDKMKMHTKNMADENYAALARLFPNALTETIVGYEEDGKAIVERAIDADVLRQEISCSVVEGREERYQFTWPDKKKSVLLANAPINKTLRPCREESVDFDNTENLYIEGDNLEVLKLLQETYLGKIKMIYIDPPYNTGNDFVYEDDFSQSTDEYMAISGQFDEEGNRLVKNFDSNGRFHTDWLNMMYPRLRFAKNLLSDDGVIFISIDDNEVENLKKICDEVFGAENFVAQIIWQKIHSIKNDAKYFSINHDYILVFCRSICNFSVNLLPRTDEMNSRYKNPDNDPRGPWQSGDLVANGERSTGYYDVISPKTGKAFCVEKGKHWVYSQNNLSKLIANDEVWFGRDGNSFPRKKRFLKDVQDGRTPNTIWLSNEVGHNQTATKEIQEIFDNKKYFDYPKPIDLLKQIIQIGTTRDDIILDFFSGSATTAHAVMKLNAEDGGNRKFIMVQLPEKTDEKSEAYKAGYKNICEIGKERIRRAANKIIEEYFDKKSIKKGLKNLYKEKSNLEEFQDNNWLEMYYNGEITLEMLKNQFNGTEDIKEEINQFIEELKLLLKSDTGHIDLGFRVLKCDTSNMKDIYYNPSQMEQQTLFASTDNIKEDRTPEDLLFQVMLDLGVLLSSKIEEKVIAGKKVFNVAEGFLMACFDSDITEETVKAVAQEKPYYAVFRDSSMANDSVATNFEQIFATYSPETVRKVL